MAKSRFTLRDIGIIFDIIIISLNRYIAPVFTAGASKYYLYYKNFPSSKITLNRTIYANSSFEIKFNSRSVLPTFYEGFFLLIDIRVSFPV